MAAEEFIEYKTVTDIDGVMQAVITFRTRPDGARLFSFSFMRAFDQNGVGRRTCWVNVRHAPAIARLLPRVVAEIERAAAAEVAYKKVKLGE